MKEGEERRKRKARVDVAALVSFAFCDCGTRKERNNVALVCSTCMLAFTKCACCEHTRMATRAASNSARRRLKRYEPKQQARPAHSSLEPPNPGGRRATGEGARGNFLARTLPGVVHIRRINVPWSPTPTVRKVRLSDALVGR